MSFIIPTGVDRGDGVTVLPTQPEGSGGTGATFGTPDATGSVIVTIPGGAQVTVNGDGTSNQPSQEDPNSPTIERAEQTTISHTIMGWFNNLFVLLQGLGRGTFFEDSGGNITRVLSARLESRPGHQGELTHIAESISFDTPPDEFSCVPVELGIDLIKHPRYSWALAPVSNDTTTSVTVGDTVINFVEIKNTIIRMIQTYRDTPTFPSANQINGLIQGNVMDQTQNGRLNVQVPNSSYDPTKPVAPQNSDGSFNPPFWDGTNANKPIGNYPYAIITVPVNLADPTNAITIALAAAKEIISKIWRQEDTPYLVGFQVTWSQFFFSTQFINPGGYIASPIGFVPDYFLSPAGDGSDTIFDEMASINPQCYSSDGTTGGTVNISWLRKSDEIDYQRTWFKYPHNWIGSPIGNWDSDLYNQNNRPQNANDFDQLI